MQREFGFCVLDRVRQFSGSSPNCPASIGMSVNEACNRNLASTIADSYRYWKLTKRRLREWRSADSGITKSSLAWNCVRLVAGVFHLALLAIGRNRVQLGSARFSRLASSVDTTDSSDVAVGRPVRISCCKRRVLDVSRLSCESDAWARSFPSLFDRVGNRYLPDVCGNCCSRCN